MSLSSGAFSSSRPAKALSDSRTEFYSDSLSLAMHYRILHASEEFRRKACLEEHKSPSIPTIPMIQSLLWSERQTRWTVEVKDKDEREVLGIVQGTKFIRGTRILGCHGLSEGGNDLIYAGNEWY